MYEYAISILENNKMNIEQGIEFNYLKAWSDTGVNIWKDRLREITQAIQLLKESNNAK